MNARHRLALVLALALPFAGVLTAPSPALADDAPAAARINGTPIARDGQLQRFVLTPRGKVMGLLLRDGSLVRVPPSTASAELTALKPGDTIHVDGKAVSTPTGTVITRAVVQRNGTILADGSKRRERGHRGDRAKRTPRTPLAQVSATGRITAVLSTPRGTANVLLLDDGTTATSRSIDGLGLRVGDRVSVSGKGGAFAQGKALRIETITLPSGEVRALPKPDRKGRHHRGAQGKSAPV